MNILYLTSEYKDFSLGKKDNFTYISNSFCRKWSEYGHKVIVIHNASCFPKIIYYVPDKLKKIYETRKGFTWGDYESIKKKEYLDQGVYVYRIPMKKIIPHVSPFKRQLNKQEKEIIDILEKNNFIPDIIIGQWISPQAELISRLKNHFNCLTAIVLHGDSYILSKNFIKGKYLEEIDKIGVRSEVHSKQLQKILSLSYKPFVCYSGLPDEYINNYQINIKKFENIKKWKIAFVGRLVKYKKIDVLIKALSNFVNINWELNIIGDGAEISNLKRLCREYNCESRIIFWGKMTRNRVMEILSECHCFVMVSVGEVFGLVYLEAMGASCITIASKNGGIDGVIKDRENGFLIDAGNEKQLIELLKEIFNFENRELKKLVESGYRTIIEFSESKVAENYLKKIIEK